MISVLGAERGGSGNGEGSARNGDDVVGGANEWATKELVGENEG